MGLKIIGIQQDIFLSPTALKELILMDGLFDSGDIGQAYMDLKNTDLYAENFQKLVYFSLL